MKSNFEAVAWGRFMANHNHSPKRGGVFEEHEVVRLLSAAINREGGQTAFANRHVRSQRRQYDLAWQKARE
jgi:hypothetical protein